MYVYIYVCGCILYGRRRGGGKEGKGEHNNMCLCQNIFRAHQLRICSRVVCWVFKQHPNTFRKNCLKFGNNTKKAHTRTLTFNKKKSTAVVAAAAVLPNVRDENTRRGGCLPTALADDCLYLYLHPAREITETTPLTSPMTSNALFKRLLKTCHHTRIHHPLRVCRFVVDTSRNTVYRK